MWSDNLDQAAAHGDIVIQNGHNVLRTTPTTSR